MAVRQPWPVRIASRGAVPVACATVAWKVAGELRVTVVVKATFSFVPEDAMRPTQPLPCMVRDIHHQDDSARSVRLACETAPYLAQAEVLLMGHAYAPPGRPAPSLTARLAIIRDAFTLLDKSLHLQGDAVSGRPERRPLAHQALVYELAAFSADENPVGVDVARGREPGVLAMSQPRQPGGFGPVARSWPVRRALLAGADPRALEGRSLAVPDGFDWGYFQASPRDQRIDFLRGDEWILLGGMHPALDLLRSRLPGALAEARVYGGADGPIDVDLVADTLAIDTDTQSATVLFRGNFVATEAELASLEVLAGLGIDGVPLYLPEHHAPAKVVDTDDDDEGPLQGTMVAESAPDGPALPFQAGVARIPPPRAPPRDDLPTGDEPLRGNLSFTMPGRLDAASPALPFEGQGTSAPSGGTPVAPGAAPVALGATPVAPEAAPVAPEAAPVAPGATPVAFGATPVAPEAAPVAFGATPVAFGATPVAFEGTSAPLEGTPVAFEGTSAPLGALPPPAPATPAHLLRPPAAAPPDEDDLFGTVGLPPELAARHLPAAVPFAASASPPRRSVPPATAPPGSPWSSEPDAVDPSPLDGPLEATRTAHFVLDEALRRALDPPEPPSLPPRTSDAVPVFQQGHLAVVTMSWQVRPPRESLTVIAKGSFAIVQGGAAVACDEAELPVGDVHIDDDLQKSVFYPSDLAFFKPKADVLLRGHAHAPGGSSPAAEVRFTFGHEGNRFARRIAVFGERRWQRSLVALAPTDPRPFASIALTYENAFGGPGFDANPVGLGWKAAAGADGVARLPHLEDPDHLIQGPNDRPAVACFAPVAATWPARWSLIGTYDARWVKTRWPYFPDDFDWAYFQSAPASQRLAYLRGDEPFDVTGVRPDAPRVKGALPGVRARGFTQKTAEAGAAFEEIVLRLDTAVIDTDAMRVDLVWRGMIEVSDDDAPEIEALFVMLEPLDGPHLSIEQARSRFLVVAHPLEPAVDSPEGEPAVANEVEPAGEADAEAAAFDASMLEEQRAVAARLAAAGIDTALASDPAATIEALRARGTSEADLAALLEALTPSADEAPRAPEDLRAKVVAMLEANEPLDGLELDGADLSDLDLRGRSLVGAELRRANLRGCLLAGADLSGASLAGADCTDASLDGAKIVEGDLAGVDLSGASLRGVDLRGSDLAGARAEAARFDDANAAGASFEGAHLVGARFDKATLASADFTRALLDRAVFDRAIMPEVTLYDARGDGASFDEADLTDARADGAHLPRARLRKATAPGSIWERATLDEASFIGAKLAGSSFVRASCPRANFSGADLTEAALRRAKLPKAQLFQANLHMATLERADLEGADLRRANLHGAETWRAKLGGADLDFAIVTRTKLRGRS